jgi:steroid delta-isomerase-like uncharacterized protein
VATTPTTRTPEEVARGAFAAIAARDLEAVTEFMHPDDVNDVVAYGLLNGREEVTAFFRDLLAAFPDLEMTVERVLADDKTAFVRWRSIGTFTGAPFMGIEPTGDRVETRGVDNMEVEDGLVKKNTIYYDGASFARAIGMLPPQGSLPEKMMIGAFNAKTALRRGLRRKKQGGA